MGKWFHPMLWWVCGYLSILGLKLIHISKREHCCQGIMAKWINGHISEYSIHIWWATLSRSVFVVAAWGACINFVKNNNALLEQIQSVIVISLDTRASSLVEIGLLPRLIQCVCRTNALCFWKGIPVNAIACHERKWSATHKLRIILADIYMAQYVRRREFIITLPDFVCIPFHKFDKHDAKIVMRTGVQNHPTLFDCNHGFQNP